jgi:predicted ATP-grasp superfamily ATP-dependent carboligase
MGEDTGGKRSVVIPTSYDSISYACVRSLGRRDVHTIAAAERADVPASASRFCDEVAVVPSAKEDLVVFKEGLLEVAARPDVRTIIPTRPEDSYVLSRYREEFAEYVSLIVPPFETLRSVHDRLRLYEAARAAGVPVPETRPLGEVDEWDGESIVKSRYNVLASEYLDDYSQEESAVVKDVRHVPPGEDVDADALRAEMGHEPVVQEFVDYDEEFMYAGLYDRGEPVAAFQHHQVRGNSYTGGGGVYRKSIAEPRIEAAAHRLLDHLDWHGLACIEYMRDAETGEFVLTEINPRMWQSLPATVRAGADFPHYYWLLATGRRDRIDPSYEVGVGSHLLYGELGHLWSIVREDSPLVERPSLATTTWDVLRSCYAEPAFDFLRLDDPGPFVRGIRRVLPGGR